MARDIYNKDRAFPVKHIFEANRGVLRLSWHDSGSDSVRHQWLHICYVNQRSWAMSVLQLQPDTSAVNLQLARTFNVIALVASEGQLTETDDPWQSLHINAVPHIFLEHDLEQSCLASLYELADVLFSPAEFLPSELFVRRIPSETSDINLWPGTDAALAALAALQQKKAGKRRARESSQTQRQQTPKQPRQESSHLGAPADIEPEPDIEFAEREQEMLVFEDEVFGDPALPEDVLWLEDWEEILATQAEMDAALAPPQSPEPLVEVWQAGMPSSSSAVAPVNVARGHVAAADDVAPGEDVAQVDAAAVAAVAEALPGPPPRQARAEASRAEPAGPAEPRHDRIEGRRAAWVLSKVGDGVRRPVAYGMICKLHRNSSDTKTGCCKKTLSCGRAFSAYSAAECQLRLKWWMLEGAKQSKERSQERESYARTLHQSIDPKSLDGPNADEIDAVLERELSTVSPL